MATAPIVPGINQGNNGATVMQQGGLSANGNLGTSNLTPATPVSIGAVPSQTAATNPYSTATSMISTPTGTVDAGVPTTAAAVSGASAAPGLVGSVPSSAGSQSLSSTDPSIFSGSSGTTLAGGLNNAYGAGIGTALADTLSTMGGQTDQAVQATISNTDLAAQQQMGNIQAQEAAGGVSPNSSTAALAESNFYNQVNSGLQSTISNEELNEEDTLINTLMSAGSQHGSSPSLLSSLSGGLSTAGSLAGSASSLVSAASPSADTGVLDAIGMLA